MTVGQKIKKISDRYRKEYDKLVKEYDKEEAEDRILSDLELEFYILDKVKESLEYWKIIK